LTDFIKFQFVYVNVAWDCTKFDWLYQVLDLFMQMLHEIYEVWLTQSSSHILFYVNVTWEYTKLDWLYRVSICLCNCYIQLHTDCLTRFVYVNVTWGYTKFDWLY
jgi:hypothetical protein